MAKSKGKQFGADKTRLISPDSGAHPVSAEELQREIDLRNKTQMELERRKAILRSFFDNSSVLMGILELEGDTIVPVRLNRAAREFIGVPLDMPESEIHRLHVAPPQAKKIWFDQIQRCIASGTSVTFSYERRVNGDTKHLTVTITRIGESEEGRARFSYIALDVTSEKRLEQSLRESEQRLSLAQDFARIGTWEFTPEKGDLSWSHSMRTIFDLGERASPKNYEEFFSFVHPDDRAELMANIGASLAAKTDHRAEFRIFDSQGVVRWIEGRGRPVYGAHGSCERMLGVAIDITDRKRTEQQLLERQAQLMSLSKMSALGEMAAGMAHEINNPLTVILGSAALAKREVQPEAEKYVKVVKAFDDILETGKRISKIIEGLRFFARDGSKDLLEPVALARIVEDTLVLCTERFGKSLVDLRVPVVGPDLTILCRPVQIGQVLLNLLNNAFDAAYIPGMKSWVALEVEASVDWLEILVSDSGPGVAESLEQKIFEPFFTTKRPGHGTGLGLGIARGIAESHGGSLSYEREKKAFRLRLPRSKIDP